MTTVVNFTYERLDSIVREGITSALILEDDADWDLRIKQQMHDFAASTSALTNRLPQDASTEEDERIMFDELPLSKMPTSSPYGDDWSVIWTGHCGMTRPGASVDGSRGLPLSYVVQENDETVPEPRYIGDQRGMTDNYLAGTELKNHTRIVHPPLKGFCSVAYAVSQKGARDLLWYGGVRAFDNWFDKLLPRFCEGKDLEGLAQPTCFTTQPQLFEQHVPRGDRSRESDIYLGNSGFRDTAVTPVIRWSTRMNLPKLLSGFTDYVDQYPDSS